MKKTMKKLTTLLAAAALTFTLAGCSNSSAEGADSGGEAESAEWPATKNIEIICPANAGSGTDGVCRALASHWGKMFPDHNFTVINDASGGYTVAYEKGRNSDTDGSTILVGTPSMLITYYFGVYDHLVTDPEEFQIINCIKLESDMAAVCVKADSPYETLDDLVEAAKANPNSISVGTGSGNIVYAGTVNIENALGCSFRKVDGADNNERITNLLGGFNDWAYLTPQVADQYVQTGDIRILAYADNQRSVNYPDIPCFEELGYPLNYQVPTGYILCANPGLSEEMAEAISSTLPGLKDDSMWKTLLNTTFKGGSWEYEEREEGIQTVKDMQIFCDDLGLGV
ncbi:MAG: tripartite tricarboxylate transporter substrate-binding protein [Lachnoclostridium edouardi]|uniref:tripartite tricarboxylate transporter substrate-binding protein n=1 Tax=Lachnoclostridium edouardi TaxID=1926283 RepID=UPI0026DC4FA5|nr:tripartite tricarboxylate transporter substrate-binding protein [Lachnoclostridium edouardi]MDO4277832.1 tripartite tricarboxylate transporter substrate-binding protein [Lachnoclostridium edouardi]